MSDEQNIELGDRAKDSISSIEGIVVARTEWLNGCIRITLQRTTTDKPGSPSSGYRRDSGSPGSVIGSR